MSKYAKEVNKYLCKIKKGDMSQMKELFNLTANHLRVVAQIYLHNKSNCDDVVSEVYTRVFKYISSFDSKKDGYNWLCKITERVAYSFNAKENVFNDVPIETVKIEYDELGKIEDQIDLSDALNKLDKEDKAIVIMYYYLGYTLEGIGHSFGKNKVYVHKRIKRILKKLKNILESQ